jgi:hypothetical protein
MLNLAKSGKSTRKWYRLNVPIPHFRLGLYVSGILKFESRAQILKLEV